MPQDAIKYTITWKLGVLIFVMFFLITILSLFTIYNISLLDQNASSISNYNDTLKLVEALQIKSNELISAEKDKEVRFDQQLVEQYRDFDMAIDEFLKRSQKTISRSDLKRVMGKLETSRENFSSILNTAYQAYDSEFGVWDTAEIPMTRLIQKRESLHKDIEELLIKNNKMLQDITMNSSQENKIIFTYTIVIAIVIFVCVIWISYYLTRKITFPIKHLTSAAREIGAGNLDFRTDYTENDEIGELGRTINRMAGSLKDSNEKLKSMLQLAVTVAHEVRNPIAGIGNAVQVMSSRFAKDDPYREIISEMINQINRVDEIISNLLTYAKPVPLKISEARIREVIANILSFIKASNSYPGVEENFDLPESADALVAIDPKQFTQVFMNVVINAYQSLAAVPEGARLTVRLSIAESTARIEVIDNGPGITPEVMARVFEPFFTTKPKGSGLGLAVSLKIIRSMGGDLTVESTPGVSTRFTIILPVGNRPPEQNPNI